MSLKTIVIKNKTNLVWAITLATVFFWIFGSEILNVQLPFTEFLDRSWQGFKQTQQRKYLQNKFRPSAKVQLLQLEYSNRVDFWFDETAKVNLANFLKSYSDPVLISMDPVHLLKDPILKEILENPNVVRPFRVEPTVPMGENLALEKIVGQTVEQAEGSERESVDCLSTSDLSKCFAVSKKILPGDAVYFSEGHLWGFPALGKSASRAAYEGIATINSIAEVPLTLLGAKLELPTPILGGIALSKGCHSYRLSRDSKLSFSKCKTSDVPPTLQLQNPLPLYFYNKANFKHIDLKDTSKADGTLVVEVIDSASYFANIHGEKYSFGELWATALSNVLQGHTSNRSLSVAWAEKILFLCALGLLLYFYRRSILNAFVEGFVGIVVGLLLLDLLATLFLNIRTEPMNGILALMLTGVVGFAILSKREYQRRNIIEKALSGYVSPDRLRNLVSGREKLELSGKKKELTTILLDIEGFGLVAKELEIGKVFTFIQKFFGAVDPIIFKNRGVIDKKTGDGLLAFCGDSENLSPKDAALSAVKAAYEIQTLLSRLSVDFFGVNHSIRARIGVNTGEMMIGNAGSERHFNYTVLGDAVNFTERLESACPAGSVLIGERTAFYVKDQWKLDEVKIMIKHEDRPVLAYKVIGPV